MTKKKLYAITAIIVIIAAFGAGTYYYISTLPTGSKETIKIGFVAPLSGVYAQQGLDMVLGARLGVDYVNEKWGGVLGRQVELLPEDDAYETQKTVAATEKLAGEGVVAIAGYMMSSGLLASIPRIIDVNHIPVMATAPWHDNVTALHDKYVFRICQTVSYQCYTYVDILEFLTQDIAKTRKPRVALLSASAEWEVSQLQLVVAEIQKRGKLEIVYQEVLPFGATDYTATLMKVAAAQPDIVNTPSGADTCYKQFYELGLQRTSVNIHFAAPPWGTADWFNFLGDAGDKVIGITTYHEGAIFTNLTTWVSQEYAKRYGKNPTYVVFDSYDSILALCDSIKRAGTTNSDDVVAALEKTDLETSIHKHLIFYMDPVISWLWHQAKPPLFAEQYQNRTMELLYPPEVATAKIMAPW